MASTHGLSAVGPAAISVSRETSTFVRPAFEICRTCRPVSAPIDRRVTGAGSDLLEKKRAQLLPEGKIYVGLAPGAGNPVKIWPRYKFEKLPRTQAAKGRVPVFILGPQELALQDALAAAVPSAKFALQDKIWGDAEITIEHTLAIAKCLHLAVVNDSGTGHMLAAADCPILSLFGPTSPFKSAPRTTHGRSLCAQDFGGTTMQDIPTEAVNNAINEMLGAAQQAR